MVAGAERVPPGPVTVLDEADPRRFVGDDHVLATYALRMRQYMRQSGAPVEAMAQVPVKARHHAIENPWTERKQALTVEEALASRMIADSLTLSRCCPTSEGPPATVLVAADAPARRRAPQPGVIIASR